MIDDKKKVGIGLVVGGLAFSGLGILLFLNSRSFLSATQCSCLGCVLLLEYKGLCHYLQGWCKSETLFIFRSNRLMKNVSGPNF